jgi:endonuclease-3
MAITINKQRVVSQLLARSGPAGDAPEPRPILQEVIYGLCREGATREQADRAYHHLTNRFFDWNEVRVSSIREIEEAFAGLSDPESRAQRLVSFLQEVFETTFSYDLEKLHKAGLKQAAKQLARYQAADDYLGAWAVQRSLGGHAIPIDPPTLRVARRLGLVEAGQEDPEAARATLEHLVAKAKGPLFTDVVSDLAEEHCFEDGPDCAGCPMHADCPGAQVAAVNGDAGARAARPRPR